MNELLRKGCGVAVLVALLLPLGILPSSIAHAEEQPKRLNPYVGDPEALKEGRKLWFSLGCSGCHSVMGGGSAMAWPVLDDTWRFGSDDATLYKLMRGQIPEQTMPPFATLPDDQVWKVLSHVRSLYKGDSSLINWATASPPEAAASGASAPVQSPEATPTVPLHARTPAPSQAPTRKVGKASTAAAVLYDIQCSICHGTTGAGDGPLALRLKDEPSDWTAGGGLVGMGDQEIVDVIAKGGMAVGKSAAMPDFPTLTEEQIRSLVAHVKGLRGNLEEVQASRPAVRLVGAEPPRWGSALDWAVMLTIVVSALILFGIVTSLFAYRGRQTEGNALWLHLLSLGVFPLVLLVVGNFSVLEYAKEDRFCGSCHQAMQPYIDDLRDAASRSLAARHFQHRSARGSECYSCHANYGVHGTFEAKLTGLRDVYRYVTRTYQLPLKMRAPYENALCLKCHGEAKRYVEAFEGVHLKLSDQLRTGLIQCVGCHKLAHDIPRVEQTARLRLAD